MRMAKVIITRCADNLTITTSGGGTSWEYYELDALESLRNLGPWLEALRVHLKVKAITPNSELKHVFWWSVDGNDWDGPHDLHTAVTTTGSTISSAYTTLSNFGIQMRYGVALRVNTGTDPAAATLTSFLVAQTVI